MSRADVTPQNAARIGELEATAQQLGSELLILGHHYQQDAVIAHADLRGDSYQLSKMAAENSECRWIVFCGVHFMAETADILANRPEKVAQREGIRVEVVLPDLAAGCSMADMAAIDQVEAAWEDLSEVVDTDEITPITYINSAASLKAFCGRHGGIVCTSSNAAGALEWALERRQRVLFSPTSTLDETRHWPWELMMIGCRSGIPMPKDVVDMGRRRSRSRR